jgi:hypothetical protein
MSDRMQPTPVVLSCKELMPFWPMYLDNELQESDAAPYLKHLDGCVTCRGFIEGERRYRQVLRHKVRAQAASSEQMPEALRERITAMAGHDSRQGAFARYRWTLAPAAFAMLVAVTFTTQSGFSPILQTAAESHRSSLPLDVKTDDVAEAQTFVDRHVPNVKIPQMQTPNARLAGARVVDLAGRRGVIVRYVVGPEQRSVSLVVYPKASDDMRLPHAVPAGSHRVFLDNVDGVLAAVWQGRNSLYSMLGDVDQAELLDLVAMTE